MLHISDMCFTSTVLGLDWFGNSPFTLHWIWGPLLNRKCSSQWWYKLVTLHLPTCQHTSMFYNNILILRKRYILSKKWVILSVSHNFLLLDMGQNHPRSISWLQQWFGGEFPKFPGGPVFSWPWGIHIVRAFSVVPEQMKNFLPELTYDCSSSKRPNYPQIATSFWMKSVSAAQHVGKVVNSCPYFK